MFLFLSGLTDCLIVKTKKHPNSSPYLYKYSFKCCNSVSLYLPPLYFVQSWFETCPLICLFVLRSAPLARHSADQRGPCPFSSFSKLLCRAISNTDVLEEMDKVSRLRRRTSCLTKRSPHPAGGWVLRPRLQRRTAKQTSTVQKAPATATDGLWKRLSP